MEFLIKKMDDNMFVRDYLKKNHAFSSRLLTAIKYEGGAIIVNGQAKKANYRLHTGDILQIKFPKEKKGVLMVPETMPLNIVAEDEDILVLNKTANMVIAPSPQHQTGTLANGVLAYYEEKGISHTVHTVTRLDRDTTGLLLIAKHRYSHALISNNQQKGKLTRRYLAIIEGHLESEMGTLTYPIGRKVGSIIERRVTSSGKIAITHYKVIAVLKEHTLVEVALETGRTHQIRVHFSHIGHPLAGDNLYGGAINVIQRQALHCYKLSFPHPNNGELCAFQILLPDDMQYLIEQL